jgi:hypothetical protein
MADMRFTRLITICLLFTFGQVQVEGEFLLKSLFKVLRKTNVQ